MPFAPQKNQKSKIKIITLFLILILTLYVTVFLRGVGVDSERMEVFLACYLANVTCWYLYLYLRGHWYLSELVLMDNMCIDKFAVEGRISLSMHGVCGNSKDADRCDADRCRR